MPLYLAELYLREGYKRGYELLNNAVTLGFPSGVTLKAGPWASNEEAKIILLVDIQDHSLTFSAFSGGVAQGIFSKRRLTPVVDWSVVGKTVNE
ncbi:MAG TPA: hypothetical protein VMF50_14040 [Candidatus Binataceae bacterium]|nr:hypothetical protein [Candidatus Binataceae bacterium]